MNRPRSSFARPCAALSLLLLAALSPGCSGGEASTDEAPQATGDDEADLVGGKRESGWKSAGYLLSGPSRQALSAGIRCGAVLIAPNVVITAAHCLGKSPATSVWSFSPGAPGAGPRYFVREGEAHLHPSYHPEPVGYFDISFYLRKDDLAYLVLERDVEGVEPAVVGEADLGCDEEIIGYGQGERRGATACIHLVTPIPDPLYEVYPVKAGLCPRDGDDGSGLFLKGASGSDGVHGPDVALGVYVGSVLQGLTECKKGVQFLSGYESLVGHQSFVDEAIARGEALRSGG